LYLLCVVFMSFYRCYHYDGLFTLFAAVYNQLVRFVFNQFDDARDVMLN